MARRSFLLVLLALLVAFVGGILIGRETGSLASGRDEVAEAPAGDTPASETPVEEAIAADLRGPLRVIDGDTFDVGEARVRLWAVDAPEGAQDCLDAEGRPWACGDWATAEARALWDGRSAACEILETDRYGRAVARCAVAGQDLGAEVVRRGMGLAYRDYSETYVPQEGEAEAAGAGLWRGRFDAPWDWRRGRREADAGAEVAEADACGIKGNISGAGRIYHLPGTPTYERTRIDEGSGERWFCTVSEAEAAGWRPSRS